MNPKKKKNRQKTQTSLENTFSNTITPSTLSAGLSEEELLAALVTAFVISCDADLDEDVAYSLILEQICQGIVDFDEIPNIVGQIRDLSERPHLLQ